MGPARSVETTITSQLSGKKIHKNELAADLYLACCDKISEQLVNLGQYTIKWKREGVNYTTTSQTTVLGLKCDSIPLDIKIHTPAHGFVRTPLIVTYHLMNKSQQILQLDVGMEASEAFMFSGYRQVSAIFVTNVPFYLVIL